MIHTLDDLSEHYAAHLTHKRQEPLDAMRAYVRNLIAQAERDYMAAGSPHSESEAGFLRWVMTRPRLARMA